MFGRAASTCRFSPTSEVGVSRPAARAGKGIHAHPKGSPRAEPPVACPSSCRPQILPTGRSGRQPKGRTAINDRTHTEKIHRLNDCFRRTMVFGGSILLTPGVASLAPVRLAELLAAVRRFEPWVMKWSRLFEQKCASISGASAGGIRRESPNRLSQVHSRSTPLMRVSLALRFRCFPRVGS